MLNKNLSLPKTKCLVAVKKVISPYATIKPNPDSSAIITEQTPMVMNPFDEIALEEAYRLKEQGFISEILAVSIGNNCQDLLLQALARGADRAIWIQTDLFITPLNIAKILHYVVLTHQINLVFLGKQAIDDNYNQTGQMLAGLLDWPQGCYVSKIAIDNIAPNITTNAATTNEQNQDNNPKNILDPSTITSSQNDNDKQLSPSMPLNMIINREIDGGIETLKITLPTVITVNINLNEPRYISLPNLMQAKKKPIEIIALSTLLPNINGFSLDNIKVQKTCITPPRLTGIKVDVPTLINKLKNEDQAIFRNNKI